MKKYALEIAAALAAGAAHADEPARAYLTLAGGSTHLNLDCTGATSCDKTDTGGKIVGGYSFGNGFSLEAGYWSLGKARGSDGSLSATIKPTAFTVGGAFSLPLSNEWGMNFRLGAAQVKAKVDASAGSISGSTSESNTKVYAGVGLTYAISPAVKLELGVDSTQVEFSGEKGTLRLISVGATFAF
jgi:OOP family OmpA-OmpF porin